MTLPTSSGLLGAGGAEQHRLRVALHHLGDAGEIDRLVAGVELARRRRLSMKRRSRKRSKSTAFGRRLRPGLFRPHSSAFSRGANYRGFCRRVQLGCAGNDRPRSIVCRPPATRKRTGQSHGSKSQEPKAAPISDGRCRASRTCASCAAPANTPTTFRCRARPTRCSCARRTRTPSSSASTPPPRRTMPGVIAVLTGADYVADGLEGRVAARQSGRRDRHQGARLRCRRSGRCWKSRNIRWSPTACAIRAKPSRWWWRRRAVAARDAAEAVEVEYEVLPAVTDVREAQRRRADLAARRPDNVALDEDVRRCRGGARGVRRGRSRGRADLRQPAHRQLPDGAALRRRLLRRGGGFLHADLRQPGRPCAAHGAGGKLRACRWRRCASSAPTSAAASGCATISIPSRPRSCGRRSASAGR